MAPSSPQETMSIKPSNQVSDIDTAAICQEALINQEAGDYEKAEELFQAALLLARRTLGNDAVECGVCLQNLSRLYRKMVSTAAE